MDRRTNEPTSPGQPRILIVEDEIIVARDLQQKLQSLGYTVASTVNSGEDALQHVEQHIPDLILMDIMLRGTLDGIATAQQIQARYNTPVVYLTAYADTTTLQRAKLTEPFGYILKPFTLQELQTTIEIALYRHAMASKLAESQQWFAATLRCLGEAVIATDTNGCVTFMNPIAELLTGWREGTAIGREVTDIFHVLDETTGHPLDNPAIKALQEGTVVELGDHAILMAKDGTETPVNDSGAPIRDGQGNIIGTVLVFQDTTARRWTETALRESESRYRALVEGSVQGIAIVNREGRRLFANAALAQMLGYNGPEEIIGQHVWDHVVPEDIERLRRYDEARQQGQPTPSQVEYRCFKKNGVQIDVGQMTTPITWAGEPAYLCMSLDITERKRLEDELLKARKLEALGVLAGGIAHSFNNLLMAIVGNLSMAELALASQEHGALFLAEAQEACKRAIALTRQLLTFAPASLPVRRQVSIADLITESADFVLRDSNVRCVYTLTDDLWPVDIDRGQMHQVLQNIILNAVQAMPTGGLIQVQAENITLQGDPALPLQVGCYVKIAITDHGNGIPPDQLSRIFDPYFTTKEMHSGLGLATAYAIVAKHGGTIMVDSTVAVGTTFTLYLPASHALTPIDGAPVGSGNKATVLIIDEEEALRELAKQMLTLLGYTVMSASDITEAIALCSSAQASTQPFAIALLDISMLGIAGSRDQVRRLHSIAPQLRIIAISGYLQDPVLQMFQQHGFHGALAKPYTLATLNDVIQRVLRYTPLLPQS